MKSIQVKFLVLIIASIMMINSVFGAPQVEKPLKPEDSEAGGTKVTLDKRVNWRGVLQGVFTVLKKPGKFIKQFKKTTRVHL